MTLKKAAHIGESPGPRTGREVLPPWPANGAGHRLITYAAISPATYERRFVRRNLFRRHVPAGEWPAAEARERATRLCAWLAARRISRVVLLGRRVAVAFGLDGAWQRIEELDVVLAAIPHPSGRCRDYNGEGARLVAGEIVRWAAGLPPRAPRGQVPDIGSGSGARDEGPCQMDATWVTFGRMNRKGLYTRDARLSIRVPHALKQAVERHAARDRRTVADTVILMLEEATERSVRRSSRRR